MLVILSSQKFTKDNCGMRDVDFMLWRPLLPGTEYEAMLPQTECKSTYIGTGDTDHSIDKMKDHIGQYAWQTEQVADALEKNTIGETATAIHHFLYNHFQYKADDENQMLRSPACSWKQRETGIDCKSYSIFASCLLSNLGIKHYIRKIKQAGEAPDEYTHVYVVVPKDQDKANLQQGYHTIDGTLPTMHETAFIGKSDLYMSLPHYGLNGTGLSGLSLKSFNFKTITNIFTKISCLGINLQENSAYSQGQLSTHLDAVDNYFANLILKINQAVEAGNMAQFSTLVNEFFGNSKMFVLAAQRNKMKGWNKCTSERIDVNIRQFKFYSETAGSLLKVWLSEFFVVTGTSGSVKYDNTKTAATYPGFRHVSSEVIQSVTEPKVTYVPNTQKSIPAFELTTYVRDKTNSGANIDPLTFIAGLTTIVAAFTPPAGSSGSSNNSGTAPVFVPDPSNPNGGYYVPGDATAKTNEAGFGNTALIIGGIAVAGYVFSKMSDKGAGAKSSSKLNAPRNRTKKRK